MGVPMPGCEPAQVGHKTMLTLGRCRSAALRGGGIGEEGGVTILLVVLAVVLLGAVGLVVDGGAKIKASQRADAIAEEAARAGGQQIRKDEAQWSGEVRVDPDRARRAAERYLSAAGLQGNVVASRGGTRLVVTTRDEVTPIFLGLLGLGSMTVTGRAEAQLVHGVPAP